MYIGSEGGNITTDNTCDITNTPAAVPVVISKDWVISGAAADSVDTSASVHVHSYSELSGNNCSYNEFGSPSGEGDEYWSCLLYFEGEQTKTVWVIPDWNGSDVYIEENSVDSAVEADNGCDEMVTVYPTMGSSCLITNTVFFEGIPTLNQYGLAILAVLMLGVGFVGFRRFV